VAALAAALTIYYLTASWSLGVRYTSPAGAVRGAQLGSGLLTLTHETETGVHYGGWHFWALRYRFAPDLPWRPYHGAAAPWPAPSPFHSLTFPLWPIPIGVAGFALYTHGLVRGTRRLGLNRCPACRYDLAGLPRGAACPECGRARG
jgi:hypothetical protein